MRKFTLITGFVGLVIYGALLMQGRLEIDIDEYQHLENYISAIVDFPSRITYARMLWNPRGEENHKRQDSHPSPTIVKVDVKQNNGRVNRQILGQNLVGHVSEGKPFGKLSDFGAGLWDGKLNKAVKEPISLAKEIRVGTVRFPGGCGTHDYDWEKAIKKNRKEIMFGIDELMQVAGELNAEPVFTLSYFTGGPKDAAALVEYLNSPADNQHPWALKRANKGLRESYGVKYFEVGNEIYHGNHKDIKAVSPGQYASDFLQYYDAMKKVDPRVQVGAVLYTSDWNKAVCEIIRDKIDFGIMHIYPTPVWGNGLETIPADEIFASSLALPVVRDDVQLKALRVLLWKSSGKDVPILVTEFNGGFAQDNPVPYRHCLGNALVNAELIRVFMDPANNVRMAHHWNFINEYWGMIANGYDGNYRMLSNPYYKRPNYYVFEMYARHFGDELICAEVVSSGYAISRLNFHNTAIEDLPQGRIASKNVLNGNWEISTVKGVQVSQDGDLLTVEFGGHQQWNYYHASKTAEVEPATFYRLSGYIKAENLVADTGVCLEAQDARGWSKTHSTASTQKVKGSTDWQYVETIYKTLPDAKAIRAIARRAGETGPVKGRVAFKGVKLEKFVPSMPDKISYLSVNASKSKDGSKVYLMVINKNMKAPMTARIYLKEFVPAAKGNAWVLNGASVDATNEKKHDNVKVTEHEFRIKENPFEFTFGPHSLTAIEIENCQ